MIYSANLLLLFFCIALELTSSTFHLVPRRRCRTSLWQDSLCFRKKAHYRVGTPCQRETNEMISWAFVHLWRIVLLPWWLLTYCVSLENSGVALYHYNWLNMLLRTTDYKTKKFYNLNLNSHCHNFNEMDDVQLIPLQRVFFYFHHWLW